MFDRRHDLELMQAQMPGMRGAIRGPCSTEDVGDLERGAPQPQPSGGSSMGDASASLSSGLVTLRVVFVATCKKKAVVLRLACLSRAWMTRMLTPSSSRWVAKRWRKVCEIGKAQV